MTERTVFVSGKKMSMDLELASYGSSTDQIFQESKGEHEVDRYDFIKEGVLVTHCTSASHEGLGQVRQRVDMDSIPGGKTLYDEINSLMKNDTTAVSEVKEEQTGLSVEFENEAGTADQSTQDMNYRALVVGEMIDNDLEIISVNISGSLPGHAIVDTGCQKTCASMSWVKKYIENLPQKFKGMVKIRESGNKFRFGNPEVFTSKKYFLIPAKFGNCVKLLGVDALENDIPLLLSRENIKSLGIVLHYPKESRENYLTLEGDRERKVIMVNSSGHDWIDIMPSEGDEVMDQVMQAMISANSAEIFKDSRAPDMEKYRKEIKKLHLQMAHPPSSKLEAMLKNAGIWRDFSDQVIDDVYKNCESLDCRARLFCQKTKKVAWRDVEKLGDLVAVDLKINEGSEKNILYIVDIATSFIIGTVIDNKTAGHVAEKLFESWYGRSFPNIKMLLSDNGLEFTGAAMEEMLSHLNIKHKTTVPYTPQQNGVVERIHAVIDANICRLRQEDRGMSLEKALIWATWAYNNAELKTGFSPCQLVYGIHDSFTRLLDIAPSQLGEPDRVPQSLMGQMVAREKCVANHLQIKAGYKVKEMLRRQVIPSREKKVPGTWVFFRRSLETRDWSGPGQILHSLGNEVHIKWGSRIFSARQDDVIPCNRNELEKYGIKDEAQSDEEPELVEEVGTKETQVITVDHFPDNVGSDGQSSQVNQNSDKVQQQEQGHHVETADDLVRAGRDHQGGQDPLDHAVRDEIPCGSAGEEAVRNQELQRQNVRTVKKKKSSKTVLPPPLLKKGRQIEFLDQDGKWKVASVINRAKACTERTKLEYYDVRLEDNSKRRVCLDQAADGWKDLDQENVRQEGLLASLQGQEYDALLVNDEGDIHEVAVTQVPFHLHGMPETLAAKEIQMRKIDRFGTFEDKKLSELSEKQKSLIIPSTWAIVYKYVNGVRTVSARLCARGDKESQPNRTDCPTASKPALRTLLSVAASKGWKLRSIDFTAAFLQGKDIERELYILPPKDIQSEKPDLVWRVVKRIYGLKDASRGWYKELDAALKQLGCSVSLTDNAYYIWKDAAQNIRGLLAVHIDDVLYVGDPLFHAEVIEKIKSRYVIGTVEEGHFTFTGWDLRQTSAGIQLSQRSFTDKIDMSKFESLKQLNVPKDEVLDQRHQKLYRSMVGMIGWCTSVSRPDKAAHATLLSMKLGKATLADARQADRVLRNLRDSPQTVLFSNLGDVKDLSLECWGDSSYGKFIPGQTVNGAVTFIKGSNGKMNVLDWCSKKLDVPVGSPLAGEVEAALEAYGRIKWMRSLMTDSTGQDLIPAAIITDSKSLLDSVANCNMVKDKRSLVGISTLRAVPEHDDTQIVWVAGKDNLADHLTKTGTNVEVFRNVLETGMYKCDKQTALQDVRQADVMS